MIKILLTSTLLLLQAIAITTPIARPAPDDKQIVFNFDSKVFADTLVGSYTHEKVIACTPAIQASYEFSSSRQITIYPLKPLQANTSYSCQLSNTSFSKKNSKKVSFHTENLYAVMERFGKILSLKFNTSISKKALKKSLSIARVNRLTQSKLHYELTSSQNNNTFLLLINEDISNDTIKVTLNKSLSPSLDQEISQTLSFVTQEKVSFDAKRKTMTITGEPRYLAKENGKLAIRIYLPYYFSSASDLRASLSIKGIENFSVSTPYYLYSDEKRKYGIPKENERYADVTANFESGKSYQITFKAGLKSSYYYQLRHDQSFNVLMGDRKQSISFESDKPYLSSAGDVGISSVNVEKATIVIEHLLDQNYRYFVTFKGGDDYYLASMAKEVARKTFHLQGEKNIFSKHKIDIKDFMKSFKSGVYRLSIHYNKDKVATKALYFSDIGITTKIANDQILVWANKLSDGSPIDDAKITIYSHKNEFLQETHTNDDGVALIEMKDIASKQPKTVVVSTDDEQSFLYLGSVLNGVSTPFNSSQAKKYKTFIYLQSKLIRPGNEAHILFVLKDKNYQSAENLPLNVVISDPTGQKVYKKTLTTSKNGSIDLDYFINENFKTGLYRIQVKMGRYTVGSSSFSVENFMPQKIKNKIEFSQKSLDSGELLKAKVSSRYLFGAPASSLKAQIKLSAVSKVYTSSKYKNFSFNNELLVKSNASNYLLRNKTLKLNKKGEANIIFDTKISQNPPSMLQVQLALTVFDDGRGVSAYEKIDLYPYQSMVGIKILDSNIEKGESIEAKLVSLNPKTEKAQVRQLDVLIKKYEWDYFYDDRGYYTWHKRYRDSHRFSIKSTQAIKVEMENSGSYTMIVSDHLSGHSSTQNFSVSGWDYTPIDPTSNMSQVQVKVDKKRLKAGFKKGDTVHVDLKSPLIKGYMLLSLETQKVLWTKVIELKKGTASLDIDLDFDMPQGVYLRTHMVRATDTPSRLIPFRASSSLYLKANKEAFKQKISIVAPKTTHSNHAQEIQITARPNSSLIVSVVDEGILQIKRQRAPKPFLFFERKTKEQIALYDLYDKVMHFHTIGKLLSFGSDGSLRMKRERKHMAPKTGAKRVKPFVYWSHIVTTDAEGKARVMLPIPAFNGQAEIVALAFDKQSIGSSSQAIIIKDDIIIKPTFSRFIHIGDELLVPVRIFNTSNKEQTVSLTSKTSKQLQWTLQEKMLTLKPNSSQLIHATLKALSFGKGDIKIIASTAKNTFFAQVELPVTSAYALQTKVFKGETSKQTKLTIPKEYFSQTPTQLFVTISDSYLTQFKGSVNSLIGYPYGCAEQTSSKVLGMLYIDKFVKGSTDQHTKDLLADRKRFIQEGIYKLHGMQRYSGEFGYWKSGGYVNPYASIYASDVMLELKNQGFDIPNDMINKIYKALRYQAKGYGNYRYGSPSRFERMYASYLLSTQHLLPVSQANTLYDQNIYKENLVTHYMMAAILKEAKLYPAMTNVFAQLESFHLNELSDERLLSGSFYSQNRDLSFSLYIHVKHFKKNALSERLLEHLAQEAKNVYSTQDKAFIMRAMVEHYKGSVDEAMSVVLKLNNTSTTHRKAFSKQTELSSSSIELKPLKGVVNYAIEVSNYIQKPLRHLPLYRQNKAIMIERTYVDENNKALNPSTLHIGDLFYSKISVQSKKKLDNLVISDRIPACFEIVNERLEKHQRSPSISNSKNFKPDYQNYLDNQILSFIDLKKPQTIYKPLIRAYGRMPNTQTFYQAMRVLSKGKCEFPAVVVEAMYDGRINAYDKAYKNVIISDSDKSVSSQKSSLKQAW